MMSWRSLIIATACTIVALPALGTPNGPNGSTGRNGPQGPTGSTGPTGQKRVGAPGPIAGAGLPVLLVAGGYLLVRRHRRSRTKAE
jgi:hypothetical protein